MTEEFYVLVCSKCGDESELYGKIMAGTDCACMRCGHVGLTYSEPLSWLSTFCDRHSLGHEHAAEIKARMKP